jgi:nicotinamide riboside transporter PnuC
MRVRPVHLNAVIATLFIVGSACFVLGSVPAYVNAVGGLADAVTYFVGSIFFTAASYAQLVQAQTPSMTEVDAASQYAPEPVNFWGVRPHDRNWLAAITQFPGTLFFNISTFVALDRNPSVQEVDRHVWRPDVFGSTLFLVASVFGLLAVGRIRSVRLRSLPWWIAWLNMIGSILFMASALASYVLPSTGDLIDEPASIRGTLLGAMCFLIGAALMFPAWKRAISKTRQPVPHGDNL